MAASYICRVSFVVYSILKIRSVGDEGVSMLRWDVLCSVRAPLIARVLRHMVHGLARRHDQPMVYFYHSSLVESDVNLHYVTSEHDRRI